MDTIKRWIDLIARMHYGFIVRPWFKHFAKALQKEPKAVPARLERVGGRRGAGGDLTSPSLAEGGGRWTDIGFGDERRYLREKQKREVDFLVVIERKPWFLVEVKMSETNLSPSLAYFQGQTKAAHAFQVVMNLDYQPVDCLKLQRPVVVPAKTLLAKTASAAASLAS